MIFNSTIDLNYFNKLLLQALTIFLSDKTNMLISTGLELTNLKCVCKDNEYFNQIFGNESSNPPAFYSYINKTIYINYQHNIFSECRSNEIYLISRIMFALFHEANHSILFHPKRQKQRDHLLWNVACDYEIHNIVYIFNDVFYGDDYTKMLITNMKNIACDQHMFLFDENYLSYTAEEIYNLLFKNNKIAKSEQVIYFDPTTGNFSKENKSTNTCKCKITKIKTTLFNGKKIEQQFIEFPNEQNIPDQFKRTKDQIQKDEESSELKKVLLENSIKTSLQQSGKGDFTNKYDELLKKLFNVKIDWSSILKNSLLNVLEKSDAFTWCKPRMISLTLPNINYLPDIEQNNNTLGTVIISRDESGSMSNDVLQKVSNIINDAKDYYKKIIVIKHDVDISSVKEFDNCSQDLIDYILKRESIGGTSHKKVFEYIKELMKNEDNQISCYIGISDLDSDIEVNQHILPSNLPIFWLCPKQSITKYTNNIRGQKIPLEL